MFTFTNANVDMDAYLSIIIICVFRSRIDKSLPGKRTDRFSQTRNSYLSEDKMCNATTDKSTIEMLGFFSLPELELRKQGHVCRWKSEH